MTPAGLAFGDKPTERLPGFSMARPTLVLPVASTAEDSTAMPAGNPGNRRGGPAAVCGAVFGAQEPCDAVAGSDQVGVSEGGPVLVQLQRTRSAAGRECWRSDDSSVSDSHCALLDSPAAQAPLIRDWLIQLETENG
jgi:hypothetical protein